MQRLFTFGVAHSNPVTAAILTAAGPAVATTSDRLIFGRPFNRRMLPGLILAICGCVTATVDLSRPGNPFDLRGGEILILAAVFCWSWYSTGAQRWLEGWSQLRISCVTMTVGGVTLTIALSDRGGFGGIAFPPPPAASTEDWLMLAWLILVLVSIGVVLWNYRRQAQRRGEGEPLSQLDADRRDPDPEPRRHASQSAAGDRRRHGDPRHPSGPSSPPCARSTTGASPLPAGIDEAPGL